MHDIGKSRGLSDPDWIYFVESATLTGYRNPPFPGFDYVLESRLLAEGGLKFDLFGRSFDALCVKYLDMPYIYCPYVSFHDYVKSGKWLTTGSSNIGRLEITLDGEPVSIKARKNMVADLVDLSELADNAWANSKSVNYAFIKSELGKLRIAVAGDLHTYLQECWLLELIGPAYKHWDGSTIDESFVEQTERMWTMLELSSAAISLPYDFKAFDHQPTTAMVQSIAAHLYRRARLNVPAQFHSQFDSFVKRVLATYTSSTIVATEGGTTHVFQVTGGLPSGRRLTSLIGNGWNAVISALGEELMAEWGFPVHQVRRWIRGDDSAIFAPSYPVAAAANLAYEVIGAQAGQGKFSVRNNATEFLRVWYQHHCQGYPARALPGLVQRKPWSNEPWTDDDVIKSICDCVQILRRRMPNRTREIDDLWVTLRHIWCRNHNLPDSILSVPRNLGGFGLESQPDIVCVASQHVPKPDPQSSFTITNQTTWRADNLTIRAARYGISLPAADASQMAAQQLAEVVVADSVPSVAAVMRKSWNLAVREANIRVQRVKVPVKTESPINLHRILATSPDRVELILSSLKSLAPLYGRHPEVATARADYNLFRPRQSFTAFLSEFFPSLFISLRSFHRSWHRSEALDYLEGKLPTPLYSLHPELSHIAAISAAATLIPSKPVNRLSMFTASARLEPIVRASPLAQLIYSY